MSPEEEAARLEAWRPIIDWMQAQAEHAIVEHADVFALLQKAKAGDPAAEKVLMACIGEIEEASAAEKAEILRVIRVRGKPGRNEGPTEIGRAYEEAVAEVIRRTDAGERQRDIVAALAPDMPGENTTAESKKTQLRDRVREERRRRSMKA